MEINLRTVKVGDLLNSGVNWYMVVDTDPKLRMMCLTADGGDKPTYTVDVENVTFIDRVTGLGAMLEESVQ